MNIKPSQIKEILDLAKLIQAEGKNFTPLFVGAPGIAKSSECQKWARDNDYDLIDIRLAYFEGPDLTGFPLVVEVNGKKIESRAIPEFWPQEGGKKAMILLEEPNRGTTMAMNTLMQLLTDRQIHTYKLPKDTLICGAMNPDGAAYDVNSMDSALLNRFQLFNVVYDHNGFMDYMKSKKFDRDIVGFIEKGMWTYSSPESLDKKEKYISPRTWEALNSAWKHCKANEELRDTVSDSVLGFTVARALSAFINGISMVFARDLADPATRDKALAQLKKNSESSDYQAGSVAATCKDIIRNYTLFDNEALYKVLMVLPADVSVSLIKDLEFESKNYELLKNLLTEYPDLKKKLKSLKPSKN